MKHKFRFQLLIIIPQPPTETAYKKTVGWRLAIDAPQTKTNQTAVLKQRISRPPPCLLPLHILRPAGVLLPLFLPQDIVNAPADLLGFPGSDRRARCGCRASP